MEKQISDKGYKQKVIATWAGITERQLSLIISGKRKCDVEEYVRICAALEVPVTAFIIEKVAGSKTA
ncbi:MAG: helix-turn-helix transcriptional regulator [Lachnospiraceae bacterium]|nr:helix-turn-helix transcriptional regulator [Lachnospiraceae bacterium]MBD5482113.1 helix-turn-helix transcriptional regulator [Lachnospiraceae bacterium]